MTDQEREIAELKARLAAVEAGSRRGKPPAGVRPKKKMSGLLLAFLALCGFCLLVGIASNSSSPSGDANKTGAAAVPKVDHTNPVSVFPSMVEDYVKPHLKDPESAKISDVTYRTRHGLPVFCGLVNAKNGFGGYTGDVQFVAIGKFLFSTAQSEGRKWPKTWNSMCVDTDATDAAKHHKAPGRHHHTPETTADPR